MYLYLRHNRSFYFVRNMFMIAMAIALVGYLVFPTAPPRFFPEWGFIDTVSDFTGMHVSAKSSSMTAMVNIYAAVPSMHVAFALMIGWSLARLVKPSVVRVLWVLYPFLMAFVIMVTANHFIFDALLGALTAGVSAYGALLAGPGPTRRLALLGRAQHPPRGERVGRPDRMAPRQRAPARRGRGSTPRRASPDATADRLGRTA